MKMELVGPISFHFLTLSFMSLSTWVLKSEFVRKLLVFINKKLKKKVSLLFEFRIVLRYFLESTKKWAS